MRPISDLKNKFHGEDIWVLAAGPSMDYVDPKFFNNKRVILVNFTNQFFPGQFVVRKEGPDMQSVYRYCKEHNQKLIISKWSMGSVRCGLNDPHYCDYMFGHNNNGLKKIDYTGMPAKDRIIVSYSTITSAMHIAALMGAANVILAGHDCGTLDGNNAVKGYDRFNQKATGAMYKSWLGDIEPQTIEVKKYLEQTYGCNIYSLNPFINFGLEGHRYGG